MKIISKEEVHGWLSTRGLDGSSTDQLFRGFPERKSFHIPVDACGKKHIGDLIAYELEDKEEALLWIDEFFIWPSCEDWNLFDRFRQTLGEERKLYESPGHVFTKDDRDNVRSLLAMVLYFFCGAIVVFGEGKLLIRISHDEFVDIYSKDEVRGPEFINKLKKYLDSASSAG